jgi:ubiquinone/menaquinone biosynthesis C-methylase UbiE
VSPAAIAGRDDAARRTARAYNAAADHYDDPALSFWERFGRATVERLDLPAGAHVLDVACGCGASALHAAQVVGASGVVIGVDLAERLLERARIKATRLGLNHAIFRVQDLRDVEGLASFDAVVCVFGIFFLPDMPGAVSALWRHVRPEGALAITTWGPRLFEPANTAFWNAVNAERPDLFRGFHPWDNIVTPAALNRLFTQAGILGAKVEAVSARHPLGRPEDWWTIVLGSGYRATVEALGPGAAARVRDATLASITSVHEIEVNVVYAVARKPAASESGNPS